MAREDNTEKTNIVSGDTLSGRLKSAKDTPPAIVVLIGPIGYVGKQWLLTSSEYIIGRSVDCPVFLDDRSVSRNHSKISVNGTEITITDLGSANKTLVNGIALAPMVPTKLSNNDQLKLGNVIFKFLEQGNVEAIANQQINEKVTKDALTGAQNRASLQEKGPEVMKRAEFLNEDVSIIVFDIDHFKKVNDTHGHAAGDLVLKTLAGVIQKKLVRSADFFARYGGEEFVIILLGSPMKAASEVAERIRSTIEGTEFIYEDKKIPVTISLGVATRKKTETEWTSLFNRGDDALYESKNNGRNKVTVSKE